MQSLPHTCTGWGLQHRDVLSEPPGQVGRSGSDGHKLLGAAVAAASRGGIGVGVEISVHPPPQNPHRSRLQQLHRTQASGAHTA